MLFKVDKALIHVIPLVSYFLIGIHSMQGWTATTKHGVKEKEAQRDYSIQEICLERAYS